MRVGQRLSASEATRRDPGDASKPAGGVRFRDMSPRDVDKLQEEIEELFADLWQVPRFSGLRHGFRPNVDCFHTDDPHALTVVVELPGVDPQSVRVVVGRTRARRSPASARGRRSRAASTSRWRSSTARSSGRCGSSRTSTPSTRRASFEHGVLTVELPVVEQPPPAGAVAIAVEHP